MTPQEYIALKHRFYLLMKEVREAKIKMVQQFLSNEYPDVTFDIKNKPEDQATLHTAVDLIGTDKAETQVICEAINQYFLDLDVEARKKAIRVS